MDVISKLKPVNYVWLERKVMEWGCMQALIDFDGWRKWKDFSSSISTSKGGGGPGTEGKNDQSKETNTTATGTAKTGGGGKATTSSSTSAGNTTAGPGKRDRLSKNLERENSTAITAAGAA